MEKHELFSLIESSILADDADQAAVRNALAALSTLSRWCQAQQVRCARRSEQLGEIPAHEVGVASKVNRRDAERVVRHGEIAAQTPSFDEAFGNGAISGTHLDEWDHGLRRMSPELRPVLVDDSERWANVAANSSPEDFGRELRKEIRRLDRENGVDLIERQRKLVRLYKRIDEDGMHIFSLRVDALTGVSLESAIHRSAEALFHRPPLPHLPDHPSDRSSFIRAHALLSLLQRSSTTGEEPIRPEIIVVVDTTVDGHEPNVDWGLPVELPTHVLFNLFPQAHLSAVVVRNGAVIHAPGELRLGRSTRLANRAQRRALRALYPTCAFIGCTAPFIQCLIHHVWWWRRGGPTDIDNLLPLCSSHHRAVHEGGWDLTLGSDRVLAITSPTGVVTTSPPPSRRSLSAPMRAALNTPPERRDKAG